MRKNPSYTTRLLISEKSATYTIKWSYTIIWQVRVYISCAEQPKTIFLSKPILSQKIIFIYKRDIMQL